MRRPTLVRAALAVLLSLCLTGLAVAEAPPHPPVHLVANGYYLDFDVPPLIENGRTLVAWRAVAEFYGFTVDYGDEDQSITTAGQGRSIRMWVDRHEAVVGGTPVPLEVPPRLVDGRTLVPVRFAAEALGLTVGWDEASRTVMLSGRGEVGPEKAAPAVPPLVLEEIRSLKRVGRETRFREFRVFTMPADRDRLAELVSAWQGAIPAVHPGLMLPMPPYGTTATIELVTGTASFSLAWTCRDEPDGGRGCTNTEGGYVYLSRSDEEPELLLVYAPGLAEFLRFYPTEDGN